jgi:hypothetical protein
MIFNEGEDVMVRSDNIFFRLMQDIALVLFFMAVPLWSYAIEVLFNGNDKVDLRIYTSSDGNCTVARDGKNLSLFNTTTGDYGDKYLSYSDTGLTKGATYTYMFSCIYQYSEPVSGSINVTTGEVKGKITRYMTWSGDEWNLAGDVYISAGGALTINGNTAVTGPIDNG